MAEGLFPTTVEAWKRTTLGELCRRGGGNIQTGPFGSQLHASDYVLVGIPCVMPQNIGDNLIVEDGIARIGMKDASRLSRYLLRAGDIVYSRRGDVGRRALVRRQQNGWLCGTGCLRVRLGDAADPEFISYYLGHSDVREWIVRHAIGATMLNLNTSILGDLPITVPPKQSQRSIAAVLGALDDKIAANQGLMRAASDLAKARYREVVHGVDTNVRLGDLVELMYGKALPAGNRIAGDVSVYGSGGLVGTHNNFLVSGPGIVVGRKGSVGTIYWSGKNFFPIDTTFYVRLRREGIPLEFVFFALKGLDLSSMNSDSAVPGLNRSNVHALPVQMPAAGALMSFREVVRPLFELRQSISDENSGLCRLRDALLPELMSGRLRVQEAEKVVGGVL